MFLFILNSILHVLRTIFFISHREREKKADILAKLSAMLDDKCEEEQIQMVSYSV